MTGESPIPWSRAVGPWAWSKRAWVLRKLADQDLLLSASPSKDFVTGDGFDYLGRHYRLRLIPAPDSGVKLERGRLRMPRMAAENGGGAATMIRWYRQRGLAWLPRRIAPWADRMGLHPGDLDVRDLGYRWGSLGKNDRLNIHWATVPQQPAIAARLLAAVAPGDPSLRGRQDVWERAGDPHGAAGYGVKDYERVLVGWLGGRGCRQCRRG